MHISLDIKTKLFAIKKAIVLMTTIGTMFCIWNLVLWYVILKNFSEENLNLIKELMLTLILFF